MVYEVVRGVGGRCVRGWRLSFGCVSSSRVWRTGMAKCVLSSRVGIEEVSVCCYALRKVLCERSVPPRVGGEP